MQWKVKRKGKGITRKRESRAQPVVESLLLSLLRVDVDKADQPGPVLLAPRSRDIS